MDTWLRDFLSRGPKTAKEVFSAGRDDGYSKDQLKRAKKRLGVETGKNGYQGKWAWSMPAGTFTDNTKGSTQSPNKKQVLPLRPLTEPASGAASSDCPLCLPPAPLLPLSEASNHGASSDLEIQREQREHDFQSDGKIVSLKPKNGTPYPNGGVVE